MVIGRMLSKMNFETVKAFNGVEALNILKNPKCHGIIGCGAERCSMFSAIITDLNMPIMDGLDLIRNTRKMEDRIAKVPIIMISSSDDKDHIEEGWKAGMNDFMGKPLSEARLLDVFKTYHLA
eukprot:TRINITY_DN3522_c0_g1_i1.p1 TRINITY_DN3522_c0_g1~~TRINITY_DN3522_c0_g1_i1.p1  ORF type:complete len:123 (+),score=4.40 TRINITY_DN3522_c0_g1_i1:141-509(+)